MNGFALLWGKLLHSSLWVQESKETRLVWITMLALKDVNGVVQSSVVGLADAAKVTLEECRAALDVLRSPDPNDTSKVEEGRRIREVPGGWQVVNNDLYRFSTEAKREFWRANKAEYRAAQKLAPKAKRAFDAGVESEFAKRRKPGVKQAKVDGERAGAQAALSAGFQEINFGGDGE